MKLIIQFVDDNNENIEEQIFTTNDKEDVTTRNAITTGGMILLAIRWLAQVGPY